MYLPDINVWLALAFPAHVHHPSAQTWFRGAAPGRAFHFCRLTQVGFLRLANNPKVFRAAAVPQDEAWKLYDQFRADPRVAFADEPTGLESVWRSFAQVSQFAPNTWADAYLAAFAIVGGYELVTFDTGFTRYAGLTLTVLK
jgi:toxin-antitoxin system PIN domain toxin